MEMSGTPARKELKTCSEASQEDPFIFLGTKQYLIQDPELQLYLRKDADSLGEPPNYLGTIVHLTNKSSVFKHELFRSKHPTEGSSHGICKTKLTVVFRVHRDMQTHQSHQRKRQQNQAEKSQDSFTHLEIRDYILW